uniref:Uncharacterized protein n=1 Tax=Chenopodium quinoa TaxID=63459 RepID=A0A803L5C8_CHEQI
MTSVPYRGWEVATTSASGSRHGPQRLPEATVKAGVFAVNSEQNAEQPTPVAGPNTLTALEEELLRSLEADARLVEVKKLNDKVALAEKEAQKKQDDLRVEIQRLRDDLKAKDLNLLEVQNQLKTEKDAAAQASASAKFLHNSDLKMSNTKTQIAELKAELEMERALRKRMQALNKKLSKELIDQSQRKQMCVVCDDLMKEITRLKEETQKMKAEMDEERKMLRMAEVLREERVQMKLADAQLFYHQEFLNNFLLQQPQIKQSSKETGSSFEQNGCSKNGGNVQRKAAVSSLSSSPETENPHIKQGIKGFVEFQRAIKAKNNGCNANNNGTNNANYYCNKQLRDLGGFSNKVECQKAQLRVLFKHKCSVPYSSHHDHNLILS